MKKTSRELISCEKIKYLSLVLGKKCIENNWKKIGVISSYTKKGFTDAVAKDLENQNKEYRIAALSPVNMPGTLLQEAKRCDAVILTEKYACTTYAGLENVLGMLEQNGIVLAGIVMCK